LKVFLRPLCQQIFETFPRSLDRGPIERGRDGVSWPDRRQFWRRIIWQQPRQSQ
jgi:hypothetical protein